MRQPGNNHLYPCATDRLGSGGPLHLLHLMYRLAAVISSILVQAR